MSSPRPDTTLALRQKLGFHDDAVWKQFCVKRLNIIHTLHLGSRKASEQEEEIKHVASSLCKEYGYHPSFELDFEKLIIAGVQSVRRNHRRPSRYAQRPPLDLEQALHGLKGLAHQGVFDESSHLAGEATILLASTLACEKTAHPSLLHSLKDNLLGKLGVTIQQAASSNANSFAEFIGAAIIVNYHSAMDLFVGTLIELIRVTNGDPSSMDAHIPLPSLLSNEFTSNLQDKWVTIRYCGHVLKLTYSPRKNTPPTLSEILENARKTFHIHPDDVVRIRDLMSGTILDTESDLLDAFSRPSVDLELFLPPPSMMAPP